jgi:nitrite reductase/ring-hydroxylating ferredoxin subunit/uncharacterized membrane protein
MALSIQMLSDRLAALPWLDQAAGVLHQAFDPLLGEKGPEVVKDALNGTWLGHPLHPALTDIPVGCWTSSMILDIAGVEKGADITLKVGTIGALSAAITGAAQWQDLQELEAPRRLGALHAVLNIAATGCYAISWVLRSNGSRPAGIVFSTTGYAIASTSAMIGGELAYRLGIGVNRVAFDEPPADWRDAGQVGDLEEGALRRVDVDGEAVMLLKDGERLLATSATCTHVGGPLDEGELSGTCVTCPWHGSEFDLRDGKVIHGPATSPIHAYETRVLNGTVQIRPRNII